MLNLAEEITASHQLEIGQGNEQRQCICEMSCVQYHTMGDGEQEEIAYL